MSARFHLLTIKEVKQETADCVSLLFEIPASLQSTFHFKPGQYLTLKSKVDGTELRRSYSICSAPHDGTLRVAVKRMEQGKFSTYAQQLNAGDTLEVMEPMGSFTPKPGGQEERKHYVAFVAGSGITPVMGIMRHVLHHKPNSSFTLVYGNRNRASIIFREEIEALKNRYMGRLAVYHLLSRETMDVALLNGRITAEKVSALTDTLLPVKDIDEAFVCGPEEMIVAVREQLLSQGMDHSNIHAELFSSPDQPSAHHEEWLQKTKQHEGLVSKVAITIDGVTSELELAYKGPSILDAALKNGADLPFACKGGVCATCRAKLIEGQVDMEVNYSLTEEEVAKGYILTCQSHPKTERVVVDFDSF